MGNSASNASFDYDQQLLDHKASYSKIIAPANGERGPIIAHSSVEGELVQGTFLADGTKVDTIWDIFLAGMKTSGQDYPFLGTRSYKVQEGEYERTDAEKAALPASYKPSGYVERSNGTVERLDYAFETYQEVYDNAVAIGRALMSIGCKAGDNIGLFSINRSEWLQSAFGIYSQAMRVVSIYATLGPNVVEYIINHAETPLVFVTLQNFNALAKTFGKTNSILKHVVIYDDVGRYGNSLDKVTEEHKKMCADFNINCYGLQEFINLGKANDIPINPPKGDDLAYIMYTSGTTGNPKGALLTHYNITSAVQSLNAHIQRVPHHYISYLPLAHIFEMVSVSFSIICGSTVYFSQGDVRYLVDDLKAVRPTFMPGVPRVFLKIYQNTWARIDKRSCIAKWVIKRAYDTQCNAIRSGQPLTEAADKRVFAVMRELIGLDRIKVTVTGSAPCPAYLAEFMKILVGPNAVFYQAYGLTEACAAQTACMPSDPTIGSIGTPFANNYCSLLNVPDMNYLHTNEQATGELLIHGPNVFHGYYKEETMSAESYYTDADGRKWLRTGDVARYNANCGTFSIISRVKSLCKLAQGEYVSLEKVEDAYAKCSILSQVWCYGNSYKPVMVGVVVPAANALHEYATEKGWWNKTVPAPVPGNISPMVTQECQRIVKEHQAAIKAWIASTLKPFESELVGFEKMKDFYIDCNYDTLGQVFNEDRETMTPTAKKRRKQLTDAYLKQLQDLYTGLGEPPKEGEKW